MSRDRNGHLKPDTIRVLEADPELGAGVEAADLGEARQGLLAEVADLAEGLWLDAGTKPDDALHLGYLVLEGALTRDIELWGRTSTELIGPGDLIQPWVSPVAENAVPFRDSWSILEPSRVAILDQRFAIRSRRFPSIDAALMDRVIGRSRLLGLHLAIRQLPRIDHRLALTFRYIADRWGVVTPAGVVIPLKLKHRTLAAMVGARRPSVSTALGELSHRGLIDRTADGQWILHSAGSTELHSMLNGLASSADQSAE